MKNANNETSGIYYKRSATKNPTVNDQEKKNEKKAENEKAALIALCTIVPIALIIFAIAGSGSSNSSIDDNTTVTEENSVAVSNNESDELQTLEIFEQQTDVSLNKPIQNINEDELISDICTYYVMSHGTNNVKGEIDIVSGNEITIRLYNPYTDTTSSNLGYYCYNTETGEWKDAVLGDVIDIYNTSEYEDNYNQLLAARSGLSEDTNEIVSRGSLISDEEKEAMDKLTNRASEPYEPLPGLYRALNPDDYNQSIGYIFVSPMKIVCYVNDDNDDSDWYKKKIDYFESEDIYCSHGLSGTKGELLFAKEKTGDRYLEIYAIFSDSERLSICEYAEISTKDLGYRIEKNGKIYTLDELNGGLNETGVYSYYGTYCYAELVTDYSEVPSSVLEWLQ